MTRARDAIAALFRVPHNRAAAVDPLPAIFPGHTAPVIRKAADGERELVAMSWGFVLPQPGKAPRRVTNTRDDKVLESRFWTASFRERRCLVPASSFCEPHDGTKPTQWVWFATTGEEPRPMFAFAGLWRFYKGPIKKDGPDIELQTFSFMTTVPNTATASINHERSPVLLTRPEQWARWLDGTPEEAMALVKPIAGENLRIIKQGFEKIDTP